jgi:hypothetical protein
VQRQECLWPYQAVHFAGTALSYHNRVEKS